MPMYQEALITVYCARESRISCLIYGTLRYMFKPSSGSPRLAKQTHIALQTHTIFSVAF